MAVVTIFNQSPMVLRYTVTGISSNPDGSGNRSNTETIDVPGLAYAYVQLDGAVVKSVEVESELPPP